MDYVLALAFIKLEGEITYFLPKSLKEIGLNYCNVEVLDHLLAGKIAKRRYRKRNSRAKTPQTYEHR